MWIAQQLDSATNIKYSHWILVTQSSNKTAKVKSCDVNKSNGPRISQAERAARIAATAVPHQDASVTETGSNRRQPRSPREGKCRAHVSVNQNNAAATRASDESTKRRDRVVNIVRVQLGQNLPFSYSHSQFVTRR